MSGYEEVWRGRVLKTERSGEERSREEEVWRGRGLETERFGEGEVW